MTGYIVLRLLLSTYTDAASAENAATVMVAEFRYWNVRSLASRHSDLYPSGLKRLRPSRSAAHILVRLG